MGLMAIRAVIIYIFILIVIRLMGKRQIGEMQPFELVITLIIADLACVPMAEISVPLGHGLIPIFTLLVVHFLICVISRKVMWARYLVSGRSVIVMDNDGINYNELKKLNMTLDDLIEALRGCNIFNLEDVSYAIIETNGKMSCITKSNVSPATKDDLKIKSEPAELPINIIMDGKIMKENIAVLDIKYENIKKILKSHKINAVKLVLIMTMDSNGNVFLQERFKSAKNFKVSLGELKWRKNGLLWLS